MRQSRRQEDFTPSKNCSGPRFKEATLGSFTGLRVKDIRGKFTDLRFKEATQGSFTGLRVKDILGKFTDLRFKRHSSLA